jgi:23S rRNA (adenine2030-N6)-methyltransferase
MNYRHAFHAGNFADCMKHAVLVWLLRALARKDKPFFVLDTHAGIGQYDLTADEAQRTGEAADGILRLLESPPEPLADYLGVVAQTGLYPGSPAIIRALLRPGDRLAACELHPEDHARLRRRFSRDAQVSVHLRDGYEALGALLPPAERRGLVLIDPPYEAPDEVERLLAGLLVAHARFPGATLAAWYPIKHRAPVRGLHDSLRSGPIRDIVAAEFLLRAPVDAARLNGCGLLVINPPYRFETEIPPILDALLDRLSDGAAGAESVVARLADE